MATTLSNEASTKIYNEILDVAKDIAAFQAKLEDIIEREQRWDGINSEWIDRPRYDVLAQLRVEMAKVAGLSLNALKSFETSTIRAELDAILDQNGDTSTLFEA